MLLGTPDQDRGSTLLPYSGMERAGMPEPALNAADVTAIPPPPALDLASAAAATPGSTHRAAIESFASKSPPASTLQYKH